MARYKGKHSKNNTKSIRNIIITAAVVMVILLFIGIFITRFFQPKNPAPVQHNELPEQQETLDQTTTTTDASPVVSEPTPIGTAYFITPDSMLSVPAFSDGEVICAPEPPVYEGYSFIGWRDEGGNMIDSTQIHVSGDVFFSAVYSVALRIDHNEHVPYMSVTVDGYFHPDKEISRGEAVNAIYSLLAVEMEAQESFSDLTPDSEYYPAACALKHLGIISGDSFRPDDPLTYRELAQMIEAFFPACSESVEFDNISSDDPDYAAFCLMAFNGWLADAAQVVPEASVTRLGFAAIMNSVLGRDDDPQAAADMVGTVMDVAAGSEAYSTVIEAAVGHHCSVDSESGQETWTDSTPLPKLEEGPLLIGTTLYYINSDGTVARDTQINGFTFDANGVYTCGDAEVDAMVQKILKEIITNDMDQMEMIRAVFLYCTDNLFYIGGEIYEVDSTDWILGEAYSTLSTGKGNCYGFSASFYVLTRALGIESVAISGRYANNPTTYRRHAWNEIYLGEDHTPYIFDTQLQNKYATLYDNYDMFWMLGYDTRFGYVLPGMGPIG